MNFICLNNGWWEFDKDRMMAYNYRGGHMPVTKEEFDNAKFFDCENWHELYLHTGVCPFVTDKYDSNVWIAPDGTFYEGNAHEVVAAQICEYLFGMEDIEYGGDELESRGWVRASANLMWEIRFDEWENKRLTGKQYDSLQDWCEVHRKKMPNVYIGVGMLGCYIKPEGKDTNDFEK